VLKRKERFGTVTVSSDSLSAAVRMHLFCIYTGCLQLLKLLEILKISWNFIGAPGKLL